MSSCLIYRRPSLAGRRSKPRGTPILPSICTATARAIACPPVSPLRPKASSAIPLPPPSLLAAVALMPLDADRAPGRFSPRPGDVSPSFAQTGTDFFLDDDSDDASEVDVGGYFDDVQSVLDGEDTYELVVTKRNVARDRSRRRGSDGVVVRTSRRQRQPPAATSELYTAAEELAVRTKFDRKLVLFLALLFMLSFLDRSSTCPPPRGGHRRSDSHGAQTSGTRASPAWTATCRPARRATTGTSGA